MQVSLVREVLRWIGYGIWIIILVFIAGFSWLNFLEQEYRASLIAFIIFILLIQGSLGVYILWRRLGEKMKQRATTEGLGVEK